VRDPSRRHSPQRGRHGLRSIPRPATLFAAREIVDPLSLYLSLKGDADERTQAALEAMMSKLGW